MYTLHVRRRLAATTGALLLATGAVLTGTSPVAAAGPASRVEVRNGPVLEIVSTETSLTAPATARPGPVTFRSSTTHEGSGWVGLARAHEDGTTSFLGGVVNHPGRPGLFTTTLTPGEYVLFDYLYTQGGAEPRERRLTVSGPVSGTTPKPTATIVSREVPGKGPRFTVTGKLRAGAPIRFTNELPGQYNEAVLFPLPANVTRAELQAFFDAADEGEPVEAPFDTSLGLGSLPLSTDRSQVFQVPLERGRHVLVTWVRDSSGHLLAQQGQFEIVDVC
ncbi:hypothetical protein [Streptomyces cyaneofuscatus]|uniref:hypothetical protein n=1 Tax=Streptomyces cyaneofuscatus TaxID=66883 RepID=UPI00363AAD95